MSKIDITKLPIQEYIRVRGYLISEPMFEAVLAGKKIKNLPKDAKIFKIQTWRPEDCHNTLNVWFIHPDFPEVPWGHLIEILWAEVEDYSTEK
jgi:hypothetical protein